MSLRKSILKDTVIPHGQEEYDPTRPALGDQSQAPFQYTDSSVSDEEKFFFVKIEPSLTELHPEVSAFVF